MTILLYSERGYNEYMMEYMKVFRISEQKEVCKMEKKEKVFLIGAGDHAKVVLSTLEACGMGCLGIYDDNEELRGQTLWCLPILGKIEDMPDTPETMAIIAIASNSVRRSIYERFKNVCWPVCIHPLVCVDSSVRLGAGTVVLSGAIVESDASVGRQSIVNSGSFVGHDAKIGNFCHLAPRSAIGNGSVLEDDVLVGMSATVRPYTKIFRGATAGMGSLVMKNIGPGGTYVGQPAKRILTPVSEEELQ